MGIAVLSRTQIAPMFFRVRVVSVTSLYFDDNLSLQLTPSPNYNVKPPFMADVSFIHTELALNCPILAVRYIACFGPIELKKPKNSRQSTLFPNKPDDPRQPVRICFLPIRLEPAVQAHVDAEGIVQRHESLSRFVENCRQAIDVSFTHSARGIDQFRNRMPNRDVVLLSCGHFVAKRCPPLNSVDAILRLGLFLHGAIQSTSRSPGTFPECRKLCVTRVSPCTRAVAAINRSAGGAGFDWSSKAERMVPNRLAISSSTFRIVTSDKSSSAAIRYFAGVAS